MASYSKVLLKSLNHGIPISHLPLFPTNCLSRYKNSSHYLQRRIKNRHCISAATRSVLEISVLCCKLCDQYFHLHTRKKREVLMCKRQVQENEEVIEICRFKCEERSNKRPKMERGFCIVSLFLYIIKERYKKKWNLKKNMWLANECGDVQEVPRGYLQFKSSSSISAVCYDTFVVLFGCRKAACPSAEHRMFGSSH